jgi:hypothetical protein
MIIVQLNMNKNKRLDKYSDSLVDRRKNSEKRNTIRSRCALTKAKRMKISLLQLQQDLGRA